MSAAPPAAAPLESRRALALQRGLLVAGLLTLLVGLTAGTFRLHVGLPLGASALARVHGPLMVGGFLGLLIGLERAAALGGVAWLGPVLALAGSVTLVAGGPQPVAAFAYGLASLVLLGAMLRVLNRRFATFLLVMMLGALAWMIGNSLWLAGWGVPELIWWWASFPVLTVAGERLDLCRLRRHSPADHGWLAAALTLMLAGLVLLPAEAALGGRLLGIGLCTLAGWLSWFDLARGNLRRPGLPRFIAAGILSAYFWLAAAGVLLLAEGPRSAGPRYDAVLHCLFLGFVMPMIFAHAPVVFPAISGLPVPFRRRFYAHLVLLHASLLLRVVADLLGQPRLWLWAGSLNAVALLLFLANTALAVRTARRAARAGAPEVREGLLAQPAGG